MTIDIVFFFIIRVNVPKMMSDKNRHSISCNDITFFFIIRVNIPKMMCDKNMHSISSNDINRLLYFFFISGVNILLHYFYPHKISTTVTASNWWEFHCPAN